MFYYDNHIPPDYWDTGLEYMSDLELALHYEEIVANEYYLASGPFVEETRRRHLELTDLEEMIDEYHHPSNDPPH